MTPRSRRLVAIWAPLALALGWLAFLFARLAELPFFADTYALLARTARFHSALDAFDLEQRIWRPLETLLFFVLNQTGLDQPWIGRLAPFGMHAIVCGLLFLLARRLGARPGTAALAVLLFALAPNTRSLGWVAAHGTPGRAVCVLAGLLLFARHRQQPQLAALGSSLCLAMGLMFHTGAIALPALCLLWLLVIERPWSHPAIGSRLRALVPAALVAQLFVAGSYLGLNLLMPNRYHSLNGLDSLPASVVRGTTFALPTSLRWLSVEGLRGHLGAPASLVGAALVLGLLCLWAWLVWRGKPALRFLLLAGVIDLLPFALAVGLSMRYMYLAFALLAVCLALWFQSSQRLALVLVPLIGLSWAVDTVADVGEQREAGEVVTNMLDAARAARQAAGPGVPIALVNLPEVWGREEDITLCNWGNFEALARAGIPGPFELWRTTPARSATEVQLVSLESIAAHERSGDTRVLWFDPTARQFSSHKASP